MLRAIKINPELKLEDNLNILMDMRAKKAQTISHTIQDHKLDFSIMVNNKRITGSMIKEIRNSLSQNWLLNFYQTKWETEYQSIMWEHFYAAMNGNLKSLR
jgi:RNA-binding protein YhbY